MMNRLDLVRKQLRLLRRVVKHLEALERDVKKEEQAERVRNTHPAYKPPDWG